MLRGARVQGCFAESLCERHFIKPSPTLMAGPEIIVMLQVFLEDEDLRKANNLIWRRASSLVSSQAMGKVKALM